MISHLFGEDNPIEKHFAVWNYQLIEIMGGTRTYLHCYSNKVMEHLPICMIYFLLKKEGFLLLCSLEGIFWKKPAKRCIYGKNIKYDSQLEPPNHSKSIMICFQKATTTGIPIFPPETFHLGPPGRWIFPPSPGAPRNQTRTSGWSFVGLQRGTVDGVSYQIWWVSTWAMKKTLVG